jgi:hypothetical protein
MFSDNSVFCYDFRNYHSDETGNGEQKEIAKKFAKGEAAMATIRLIEVEDASSIGNKSDTYSILPIPKLEKTQQEYYSFIHDSFTGMAIPATTKAEDLETIGKVLEKLGSESYKTVTQAYFEKALKGQYTTNEESVEMLDMIMNNVKIDAGVIYTKALESVHQQFRNIMLNAIRNGKGNQTSTYYSADYIAKVATALDTLQTNIKKVQAAA